MFPCQAGLLVALLMDFEGLISRGQQWVTLLVILALADVMFVADFCDGLPLQPLKHDHDLCLGIPCSSVHG
jgi:hypothetical protein